MSPTSEPIEPKSMDAVPAYQQALYLRYLDQMAEHGVGGDNARAHARAAAWRAADDARARIERAWPTRDTLETPPKTQ